MHGKTERTGEESVAYWADICLEGLMKGTKISVHVAGAQVGTGTGFLPKQVGSDVLARVTSFINYAYRRTHCR
jgi:hypothetical protein